MCDSWWTGLLPFSLRRHVEGRPLFQRIIDNTGWLFADNLLRMGVGLLVSAWVARYLGPEEFGAYNYAIAFVALFATLATLGLENIVIRDLVRDPSSRDEILGSAFLLKLSGGVLTLLVALTGIHLLRPDDLTTGWLVGITAAGTIFQAFDTVTFWFRAQIRSKLTVYAKNAAFLVVSLAKVALILMKAPLVAFAWAGLAEVIIGSVGLVIAYQVGGSRIKAWRGNLKRGKKLLRDSWPLILSGIAIYIQARVDQVMLGEMVGNGEVGQYSAAMRLIEVFAFLPMIIQSSVAPAITQAKIASEEQYYERLLNVYRIMTILFLVTAVPVFFLGTPIVIAVFGEEYRAAGALLSLFALRLFFANLGVAKNLFITNENLFRYSLATAIAGSIVNVGLNFLLIPEKGAVGAVWAMIVSFFVTTFFIDFFYPAVRRNLWMMLEGICTPWKLKLK